MEMNSKVFFLLFFLAFSQLALVSCRKSKTNNGINGFTVDLIHRDSPLSPYYNPSITPSQRLRDAFHRSFPRASFFKKASVQPTTLCSNPAIQSEMIPMSGEYLMKIAIGTPPRETFAIADTASDLTWIQCKPCTKCFKQILPFFDPRKSSTYKTVGCHSRACEIPLGYATCVRENVCEYEMRYGDNSRSYGDVAFETFTFASTTSKTKKAHNISIPHVIFGCGHHNDIKFSNQTSGIVGLGGSKISIIKQLDKQIKGRFSYCLVPVDYFSTSSNATSKINFGRKAVVSGPNVLTTPIKRNNTDTFYYLNLEGVSVGEKKLEFKSSQLSSSTAGDEHSGNIIIDSGTTLTLLPFEFYIKFESTLVKMINGTRKEDPQQQFVLCYDSKKVLDIPKIVFHFTDADIELLPMNTFAEIEEGLSCSTIVTTLFDSAIYGNLAQMNFHIGYDLVNHKLSFLPTDCTKH